MRRDVKFKQAKNPVLFFRKRVVYLFLLFLFIAYRSVGASFGSPEFDENSDSTSHLILFEKLMHQYETDGTRSRYRWPPIWDVPQENSPSAPHFVIVTLAAVPRINEISINEGDYIGGFCTDDNGELKCGGAKRWNDTANIILALHKDDSNTPEKDGFVNGEKIYFKFFSWTTQKDYDIDVIEFDDEGGYSATDIWHSFNISAVIDMQALVDMDFYINADGNPICIGNQLYLSSEEFIGTGGPYTFNWSSDPPGFNSNLQVPPSTTPDETTTYYLTVEDGVLSSDHEMTVIVNDLPEARAGTDGINCANETYSLNGIALNFENITWASSGDGTFDDPTSLNTNYTPGEMDGQNGSATITLLVNPLNPCLAIATDQIQLEVIPLPYVSTGGDMSACGNDAIILQADVEHYSSILWTTSGDGKFEDTASPATQYFPGANDISDGVDIEICAEALIQCIATVCDNMSISFLVAPSCNAPSNRTKCENVPVPMAGSVSNNSGILWTTQGDGYFVDPSVINAQYIAGTTDRENGGTIVTLNALPIAPCTLSATKDVNVILKPLPEVNAGNTNNVCKDSYLQLDASLDHSNNDVQVHIYPNPTSGKVNINLIGDLQVGGEISICYINGQLVYATEFTQFASDTRLNVDLAGLTKGVYYLRITSDWFTKTEKIVLD